MGDPHSALLACFDIDASARIGHGGEATVYGLPDERILRVYHGAPHELERLAKFYAELAAQDAGFSTPEIFEHGEIDGVTYSVDRRIAGRSLMEMLPDLRGKRRGRALDAYFEAGERIRALRVESTVCGELLREDAIQTSSWRAYLRERMARSLAASREWLGVDVPPLDGVVEGLRDAIEELPDAGVSLVHGDYFPGNVMMDDDLAVTGVIDFGPLTVIGDPAMDTASGVISLEVARGFDPGDTTHVMARAVERHGETIRRAIDTYRAWYAVRFSPYRADDEWLYAWCVKSLTRA